MAALAHSDATGSRPTPAWLTVVVLLAACAARGAHLALATDAFTVDRDNYRELAINLLEQGVYGWGDRPTAFRPPLYPLCLAAAFTIAEPRQAALALHFVWGAATILCVYGAARKLDLGDWALFAALLVAFDPLLLHQSQLYMTETLATFLASLAWLLLVAQSKRLSLTKAAAAGVVLGLASLARPTFLIWWGGIALVGLLVPAALGSRKAAFALATGAALCLIPWTIRNQYALGAPIPTTTHGGYTLLLANNPGFYQFARSGPWGAVWSSAELDRDLLATLPPILSPADELANDRRCQAMALENLRNDPRGALHASLWRVASFWGVLPHAGDDEESRANQALRYLVAVEYAVVFLLMAVGLVALGSRLLKPPWLWAMLAALVFTAVHAVYWSNMRMRAPMTPLVACAAAYGARVCWRGLTRAKRPTTPDLGAGDSTAGRLDPPAQASL